jgi:hypothetical protein
VTDTAEQTDAEVEPLAAADYDLPVWMQALSYPAATDRLLVDAAFPTAGVLGAGELLVAPRAAGGTMSVDVAAGRAVIAGTDMALQGKYVGRLKNTVNVPLTAAPGAGLTRIDLICARMIDATVVGGAVNAMTVETPVLGTAVSSNPAAPAVPASSIPLAQILVASGTAAITAGMITDRRTNLAPAAQPALLAAEGTVGTDAFGNFSIAVPGRKVVTGIAMGAQSTLPFICVRNLTDVPAGGTQIAWRVFRLDGSSINSQAVSVAYLIWHTA